MKTLLIILLLLCSFSFKGQDFIKHTDTLLYRKLIPVRSSFNPDSINKRHFKEVKTHVNYPIQIQEYAKTKEALINQKVDTIPFSYYSGEPYKKGLIGCVYINPSVNINFKKDYYLPHSALFYQNPSHIEPDLNTNYLQGTSITSIDLSEFFKPFYIADSEVSNLFYRQFVNYVRDSIARRILGEEFPDDFLIPTYHEDGDELDTEDWNLNWEADFTYDNEEYSPFLAEMNLPESERFYQRVEIDTRKLIYAYYDDDSIQHRLNIYPDTLSWIHDFETYRFESLSSMYFWHPAYDNYPVVGVNWHQAKAFCYWLTQKLQKQHKQKGSPYQIKVDLPSIIQWNTARTPFISKEYRSVDYPNIPQIDWRTDLLLKDSLYTYFDTNSLAQKEIDSLFNKLFSRTDTSNSPILDGVYYDDGVQNKIRQIRRKNTKYRYNYLQKELSFHEIWYQITNLTKHEITYPYLSKKQIKKYKKKYSNLYNYIALHNTKHTDNLGIKYMGNNVSEWLLESYEDNWKYLYYKRNELLIKSRGADADIQALTEEYFNTYNDENGRLIMGANWYDQRDGFNFGKNLTGTLPKVFKSPSKSYSTVGFRYVITIEE